MSRSPLPTCPTCHGAGDIEHRVAYWFRGAPAILLEYSPCPCTYSPIPEEMERFEDWTKR